MHRLVAIPVLAIALSLGAALAAETDQYYAWGTPITDSTDVVNARFNLELERSIASFPPNRPPQSCRKVAGRFRSRMRSLLLHEIQIWAWNSRWVARIPDGGDEQRAYRDTNLYSHHPWFDPGTWMPYTPTISVAGVRFGTDKLAHVVSSGWTYFTEYEKGLKKGLDREGAERRALRRGVIEEAAQLGGMTSGVKSFGDVQSSYDGMHLYIDLCNGDDPILEMRDDAWVIARPIDLREYVNPLWDESFFPPAYKKSRWRRVRPVLVTYCDLRDDPWVVAQRARYESRENGSLVVEILEEQVALGKPIDPADFSLDAVCPEDDAEPPGESVAPDAAAFVDPPADAVDAETWKQRIVDEENDRRRYAIGLFGLQLAYPQVVTASLAVMPVSQPRSYDCRTPCIYRGPFLQVRPGLGGGSVSAGWGRVTGNAVRGGGALKNIFVGKQYKLTALRTWGGYSNLEPGEWYVGPELALQVGRAGFGIGVLRRVSGDEPGKNWRVTAGVGWGF